MKKIEPKLAKDQLKSLYINVLKGATTSYDNEKFGTFYVKHLDMNTSTEIDESYQKHFEKQKAPDCLQMKIN